MIAQFQNLFDLGSNGSEFEDEEEYVIVGKSLSNAPKKKRDLER